MTGKSVLTDAELAEIERANDSGRMPVVFVHGLWLLSSSWDRWRALFEEAGYATLAPIWPDDPDTVEAARQDPGVFANKMVRQVTDHFLDAIGNLTAKPAVIGHSFGGLIAQEIAGTGEAAVTVAVSPAPFRGVLPLPLSSLKAALPVLGNPANAGRAVSLTYEQFRYGWVNALDEEEGRALFEEFHVAAAGIPIFEAATANLNPFSQVTVDTENPDRGPLLIISGQKDHTVPWAIAQAAFKLQQANPALTEIVELPNRGHSLTIDSGWREVAELSLDFVRRHG
ncbi:pimeloyl-ACP methyl ester carboxylesterase [Okibacterium sp. HSC-33S16]|uniref:alpha/beta hydrolase n=1 Tax=Okibacterium sp. HSC-33S16 TaxID=2910965 RepID=UPI0020A0AD17|nr:alpha/beta hydrolase [Okibacterium sp. HSC-33S16]MCP2032205.1 pimeloyl-ACP methyl ester carboxylesterase [Okibacterium sp. HSC-33S16]